MSPWGFPHSLDFPVQFLACLLLVPINITNFKLVTEVIVSILFQLRSLLFFIKTPDYTLYSKSTQTPSSTEASFFTTCTFQAELPLR
jgi:hypothetical protein